MRFSAGRSRYILPSVVSIVRVTRSVSGISTVGRSPSRSGENTINAAGPVPICSSTPSDVVAKPLQRSPRTSSCGQQRASIEARRKSPPGTLLYTVAGRSVRLTVAIRSESRHRCPA